ncbi:hypothetical protein LguiA_005238 [Lonicera macranthoides]
MRIFPAWMQRLWEAWDIRVMVLWSLTLQIILISFGGRRKHNRGIWIKVVVWSVYMMADWVAVFSLGKLSDVATFVDSSNSNNNVLNNKLMALWAPLLLLHLGGPDTITAYSIEDVRLYLRHALGVIVQVGLALYVFLLFWTGSIDWISLLSLPLFVAGILKYGERSWVLWRANSAFPQPLLPIHFDNSKEIDALKKKVPSEGMIMALSYVWLQNLAPCLASFSKINYDLISSEVTEIIWGEDGVETAFKFFEFQLGFMYDMLYTKANNIYTKGGCIVRLVSFICLVTTLLGFTIIGSDDNSNADTYITYVLLVGAVVLELYALTLLIYSDWAIVWMSKHCKNHFVKCIFLVLAPIVYRHGKRWASSLPTLNLLNESLYNVKPAMLHHQISRHSSLEKFKAFTCRKDVDDLKNVKILVMEEVRLLLHKFSDKDNWHNYFEERGENALQKHGIPYEDPEWCIVGRSFDISILIWHLATNYCYYLEDEPSQKGSSFCEGSKLISEYMVYLLIIYPNMLGDTVSGCDLSAIQGYYAQMMEDTRKKGFSHDEAEVCRRMFEWEPNVCTCKYSGSSTMQSLEYGRIPIDARELAKTFMTGKYKDRKWEIISRVWTEMLCHGAVKCKYDSHIRQLVRGGEFISQVWILLFMHGLIDRSPRDELRPLFACAIKEISDSAMGREVNGSEEDEIYGGTSSDEEMDASWLEEGLINRSIHKARSLPVEGTRKQNGN